MPRSFRNRLVVGVVCLVLLGALGYAVRQSVIDLGVRSDALLTANLRGAAHLANAESALLRLTYDATDRHTLVAKINGSILAYEGHVTTAEEREALREWRAAWAKDATGAAAMKSLPGLVRVQRASGEKTLAAIAKARASAERLLSAMIVLSLAFGASFVAVSVRGTRPRRLSPQGAR